MAVFQVLKIESTLSPFMALLTDEYCYAGNRAFLDDGDLNLRFPL